MSVVGTHAGETLAQILDRKREEIKKAGKTFWLYKSHSAKPSAVQKLANSNPKETVCLFIHPSTDGGAKPTKHKERLEEFSSDGLSWQEVPEGILVTGDHKGTFALVLKDIEPVEEMIDTWDYSSFADPSKPLKTRLGDSTLPVIKKSSENHPEKMKSNIRKVVAVAKLTKPFGVWLRNS